VEWECGRTRGYSAREELSVVMVAELSEQLRVRGRNASPVLITAVMIGCMIGDVVSFSLRNLSSSSTTATSGCYLQLSSCDWGDEHTAALGSRLRKGAFLVEVLVTRGWMCMMDITIIINN